jgi:methyl-accepting chemotaxis protein WspA
MFQKLSDLLGNLLKQFTFRQRFIFFASIFFVCLPLPFYWFLLGQNLYIRSADNQIKNYHNQMIANNLLNDILLYHLSLNYETNHDAKNLQRNQVLFDLGVLKNQQIKNDSNDKQSLYNAEQLRKLWQKIDDPDFSKSVHSLQLGSLMEMIQEQLNTETLGDGYQGINLLPENQALNFMLCNLYYIQIYMFKLLIVNYINSPENSMPSSDAVESKLFFYINLSHLKDAVRELQWYVNHDVRFRSLSNDPQFNPFFASLIFSDYLTSLNDWIADLEKSSKTEEPRALNLIEKNKNLTEGVLNLGIALNQINRHWHLFYKTMCIVVCLFSMGVVLFYVFFHVLTNHFLELDDYIKALAHGKFKKCFCSLAGDEFGPVGVAFDKMSQTVQQVVGELQRLGRQLAESINQISQSTIEQNTTFLNDEKKIKEVEDYTKTIANRTQNLAKTMNELSLSSEPNILSEAAKKTLEKMRVLTTSLSTRSMFILQHLQNLKKKIEGNKNLFSFLIKVSNQADLLSLNSAIVASNIVNNKQSFVKISHEIKRFADKTASSTNDMEIIIRGIFLRIDNIQNNTNKFLKELHESTNMLTVFEKHLGDMILQMEDQTKKFQQVNKIMQEQADRTDDIKKTIDRLANVATANSEQTRQLGKAMAELSLTSEKLQHVLSLFFHPKQRQKLAKLNNDE